jgi:hypothetical protein
MLPRVIDIVAIASAVALGAASWVFGRVAMNTWRDESLRYGFPYVAMLTSLVLIGFVVSLMWCRHQWRDYRWIAAERRGRCGRCGHDLRGASGELCPECGFPRPAALRERIV